MDVISGIASVSQLGAYGQSAARCLQRLYLRVHEGPSLYQREKTNISALLDVIKRVCKQESVATENVLALLVDISSLASDILSLLQRHGFLGINWTLVICPQSLSDAFQALTAKRELLHLSIAQSNHELSIDIQKNFEEMNQTMSNQHKKRATTEHTGSGPSDAANEQSINVSGTENDNSRQSIANGYSKAKPSQYRKVTVSDSKNKDSVQDIANSELSSFAPAKREKDGSGCVAL